MTMVLIMANPSKMRALRFKLPVTLPIVLATNLDSELKLHTFFIYTS
jgi:hypothetical protein